MLKVAIISLRPGDKPIGRYLVLVRANRDLTKSCSRFIFAVTHIADGLELCKSRIAEAYAAAPRLLEGTAYEVVNLTDTPGSDLDYYAYELGRLRHVAVAVLKVFGEPAGVVAALATFDIEIPDLKAARDPLTHPNDNALLDDVAWLGALVRLEPAGGVEYLIDTRYEQHDAAKALADAVLVFLRDFLAADLRGNTSAKG